jgi:hypothetical protein
MATQAALIGMGLGSTLQAFGEYKQGADAAEVAKYNADVAKLEGTAAVQEASSQEQIKRTQIRSTLSRQRLLAAAGGAGVGGTTEDVIADSARAGELDALAIRMGGQLKKDQARYTAALYKAQGQSVRGAGLLASLATGLGGAGRVYTASRLLPTGTG